MILTLILKDSIHSQSIPEKVQGLYWVKRITAQVRTEELLSVEAAGSTWILKSTTKAHICAQDGTPIRECPLQPLCFYKIRIISDNADALLYCENSTEDRKVFTKLILPQKGSIKIGRSESNNIAFSNAFVSSSHAVLDVSETGLQIRDCSSSNGTFVNDRRISESRLNPGDTVFIVGLKIIIGKGFIAINNPDRMVRINGGGLLGFKQQEISDRTPSMKVEKKETLFYRSPRFKRDIKTLEVSIDSPPSSPISEQLPILLTIGPAATMGLASLAMATTSLINLFNGKSDLLNTLPMLVMAVAMLCGTLLWPSIIRNYEKKKKDKKEALRQSKYKEYINSIKDELNNECSYQREILNENFVSTDVCLSRIKLVQRNLWERTVSHNDFLTLRLGRGNLPLDCDIKSQKRKFSLEEDSLLELQYRLHEQPQMLTDVPITLPLLEDNITGVIGKRADTVSFAKSLLFQLVALHSYDEVKVVVICNEADESWKFVKWIPHLWNDEHDVRFLATNQLEVKEISSYLERELSARTNSRGYDQSFAPHYVVFALDQTLAERADFMKLIYKNKQNYGFSVLAIYDELKSLPKECSRIVELSSNRSRMYDRDDISGMFVDFIPEFFTGNNEEEYAIALANITLDNDSEQYNFPSMITFAEAYDVGRIEHLNILARWKENDPTTSLDAVIGVDEYGEKFSLNIHEKAHGPHGLIAGTTGSGKSEFIMTYILAMAINYHPSEVAFILIDYKGGGMAKAFENLPHTAGIITNLDGSEVNRSLVSIKSELRRRQALFTQTSKKIGVSNIDIYKYQRLYRDGTVSEPLPHLIIISDEFAELKAQQPDFMAELISTARIGRSLGVHLILATQKPTGVVDDQIVSNTRFRVCLKVQDRQDSMEMLKRPEAADLTVTGRFFLQIGNNELFKLGQSAWSGAKYQPSDRVEQQVDNSICVISNTGKLLKQMRMKGSGGSALVSQLDAITEYISRLVAQEGFVQRMLWCPSMPAKNSVDNILRKYGAPSASVVAPVIGEYDVPALQRQEALALDFRQMGNIAVYGASGGGKTTFVTTLIYSLITQYTAEQVNIYAADFASQTLSVFGRAPHVGDIIIPDDEEKINNLFKLLQEELKKRKQLFQEYGGDYSSYQQMADKKLPCIVVIIHNYSGLVESYDVEDQITFFTREGPKRGIYFVVTAQSSGAIRHRILQNFGQLFVMRMNDPLDYSAILGNVGGIVPAAHLGRGIFKQEDVYEFQVAKCSIGNEVQHARETCVELNASWKGFSAQPIPVLPDKVDAAFLASAVERSSPELMPIGVDREKMTVFSYPLFATPMTWVLSESGNCGLFAQGLAEAASAKEGVKVTVLDSAGNFIRDSAMPYEYASDSSELNDAAAAVFSEMLRRHNELKTNSAATFPRLLCIVTSISSLETELDETNGHNFFDCLNSISKKYGICFVICDSSQHFCNSANKDWIRSHTTFKDVIWIGGGLANNFRLQVERAPRSIREPVSDNGGFALVNGSATALKMLVPEDWEQEEIYG
ncbi:MAG: type VII secretion protein EssC [Ruminococcaceae bacterium]|nr:type VII secretion protein EssC [Oscillospiraceae bacterium]